MRDKKNERAARTARTLKLEIEEGDELKRESEEGGVLVNVVNVVGREG